MRKKYTLRGTLVIQFAEEEEDFIMLSAYVPAIKIDDPEKAKAIISAVIDDLYAKQQHVRDHGGR